MSGPYQIYCLVCAVAIMIAATVSARPAIGAIGHRRTAFTAALALVAIGVTGRGADHVSDVIFLWIASVVFLVMAADATRQLRRV